MQSPFSSRFANAISMFTNSVYLNSSLHIKKKVVFKIFKHLAMVAMGLWGSFCCVLFFDTLRRGVSQDVLVME